MENYQCMIKKVNKEDFENMYKRWAIVHPAKEICCVNKNHLVELIVSCLKSTKCSVTEIIPEERFKVIIEYTIE